MISELILYKVFGMGTPKFHEWVDFWTLFGYPASTAMNIFRCQARDPETAESRQVKLADLTTRDLICWFERSERFFDAALVNCIQYARNPEFDPRKPLGYQWSRVQIRNYSVFENTRQLLCLHCQAARFFNMTGRDGYFFHVVKMHPHEAPAFLRLVMQELGLNPLLEPVYPPDDSFLRPFEYEDTGDTRAYRQDGHFNQLRLAPRPHLSNMVMNLSQVNENHIMFWFCRDPSAFAHSRHERYREWPFFDANKPVFLQICRSRIVNGCSVEADQRLLCLYCQEPRFYRAVGPGSLYGHIAMCHYGFDLPPQGVVQAYHQHFLLKDKRKQICALHELVATQKS